MDSTNEVVNKKVHQGYNISMARARKNMKQTSMADLLGISQQRLSQMEGQKVVRDEILEKIAEITGVSVEELKTIEQPMSVYIENNNTITDSEHDKISIGNSIEEDNFTNHINPLDKITELYERLLKEEKARVKELEKRIAELEREKQYYSFPPERRQGVSE